MSTLRERRRYAVLAFQVARKHAFDIGTEDLPGEFDWQGLGGMLRSAIAVLESAEEPNEAMR